MDLRILPALFLTIFICSCSVSVTDPIVPDHNNPAKNPSGNGEENYGEEEFAGTIAVAKITIDHPLANRVFSSQLIQDSVVTKLGKTGKFKIIDWSRFREVLFRRNLEWSDVVADVDQRQEIKDVLLNDFFLTGSVFSYGERLEYSSSALSKQRAQIAEVKVELFLKDALSNEIIASARGEGVARRIVRQTLGFGTAGTSDTALAHAALDEALEDSLGRIVADLSGP